MIAEIKVKVQADKIKEHSRVKSDRLRSIASNSQAKFAPIFNDTQEGFSTFMSEWRAFEDDLGDSRLLLLYLKAAVSAHPRASKLLSCVQDYRVAINELSSNYSRQSELATILVKRLYKIGPQAQSVSAQMAYILDFKAAFFKLSENNLEGAITKTLVRFLNSKLLEQYRNFHNPKVLPHCYEALPLGFLVNYLAILG